MTGSVERRRPDPLPAEAEVWAKHRKLKTKRALNDMVEECHVGLLDNEDYLAFLEAVWDEDAREGSLAADNLEAASMIRIEGQRRGISELAAQKKATISKCLGIILRRYEWSRKERRQTVHGELVPTNDE